MACLIILWEKFLLTIPEPTKYMYYDVYYTGYPPKGIAELSVYFEHSSKPNQIECTGKTDEDVALCKSLNL